MPKLLRKSILKKVFKTELNEERTYFALTLMTGVISGLIAVGFHKITQTLSEFIGSTDVFTLKTTALAGLAIFISGYLTTRYFPSTEGSGVPGVKVALAVFNGKITLFNVIAKFVTSTLTLSSGISLGREGPTVAITAGIGSILGHYFNLTKKRLKGLVAVGATGGIAAAFNTPIAAVVFTLEEVVGDLNAKLLGSIVISSVIASVTAGILHGNHPTFTVMTYTFNDPRELFFYLIVGLVAAVVGPLWVKSVMTLRQSNMKIFKGHKLTIIMITFLAMAALSLLSNKVLGSGHETVNDILLSRLTDWRFLLTLFVLKFFATTICYASGVSGGLFMPCLFIGATLGALVGCASEFISPDITSQVGAYALVGMGAFFAAVIRAPFTSIIMIFELTRDYAIVLPLMIANITAYVIAGKIHEGSIYENISEQDGIHLPTRDDDELLESLHVEDAMIKDVQTFNADLDVKSALNMAKNTDISGYPVMQNGRIYGVASISDIGTAYVKELGDKHLRDICTKRVIKIYPDQSLLVAFHRLKKHQISRLLVVSRLDDKHLVGIITAEDIVNKFGYHVQEDSKEDLAGQYEEEFARLKS